MPTPVILVDGVQPPPLGSKTNGTKLAGSSPTLSLASTLGIESVEWRLSKPNTSSAAIATARPSGPFSTTVGPLAAYESYIVTCIANDDPLQVAECEIAVPSPVHALRVPRFGEAQQWDPTDGWEGDLRAMAQAIERPNPTTRITGAGGSTNVSDADQTIYVNTAVAGQTIVLPNIAAVSTSDGRRIVVKGGQSASTHNVVINGNGANIDASATYTIAADWGGVVLVYVYGSGWIVAAKF